MSDVILYTAHGELAMLRDVVLRAHQLTAPNLHVQGPEIMVQRAHRLLEAAVEASPAMRGFLGRGGPEAHRDILSGTGDLT